MVIRLTPLAGYAIAAGIAGTVDGLFGHWILGEGATPTEPRWSIIRDVLHWIE